MAVQTVTQSAGNLAKGSWGYKLSVIVNALSALANELKSDHNTLRTSLLNGCFSSGGWTEGTNANTIQNARAISFAIGGQLYYKAATDNIAMTACAQQAAETYCMYLVTAASNGAITITKGTEVATDTAVLPAAPASSAVVAAFKIQTAAATTFTSGTTDLSAAGITDTWYDLMWPTSGAEAPTATASADADTVAFRETGTPA